jgi:hypothetical protein
MGPAQENRGTAVSGPGLGGTLDYFRDFFTIFFCQFSIAQNSVFDSLAV